MSTYATRLGMLKGWLLAKDAPQTILNIADEMLANEGEEPDLKIWMDEFKPTPKEFLDHLNAIKKSNTANAIGKRKDSLPTSKNPVDIVNTALKKLSSQNPSVKKNRKPKAKPRLPTKKK